VRVFAEMFPLSQATQKATCDGADCMNLYVPSQDSKSYLIQLTHANPTYRIRLIVDWF
jgi:hypothetical protein